MSKPLKTHLHPHFNTVIIVHGCLVASRPLRRNTSGLTGWWNPTESRPEVTARVIKDVYQHYSSPQTDMAQLKGTVISVSGDVGREEERWEVRKMRGKVWWFRVGRSEVRWEVSWWYEFWDDAAAHWLIVQHKQYEGCVTWFLVLRLKICCFILEEVAGERGGSIIKGWGNLDCKGKGRS